MLLLVYLKKISGGYEVIVKFLLYCMEVVQLASGREL